MSELAKVVALHCETLVPVVLEFVTTQNCYSVNKTKQITFNRTVKKIQNAALVAVKCSHAALPSQILKEC